MHKWGDPNVDWDGLNECPYYIGNILARYGRINVSDMKEKYGTVRVYCHFGVCSVYSLLYPFRHWLRGPLRFTSHIRVPNWINGLLIIPYQSKIYRLAYRLAIKKYPHLREEILNGADFDELLEDL